jgi:hypothetical protein
MMNPKPARGQTGARYRGLLIIWGAQFFSLIILSTLTRFIKPDEHHDETNTVIIYLVPPALLSFAVSFMIKSKQLAAGVRMKRPDVVTAGYVMAFALCEASALIGLFCHYATADPRAVYFFALTALGLALHFPRRRYFEEAAGDAPQTFKTTF